MNNGIPIKFSLKDLNEALNTGNTRIILVVLREYAAFKKKGSLHLTENFRFIEFALAIKKLGLVLTVVPNERAKEIWK
jgi:hypothetical protein